MNKTVLLSLSAAFAAFILAGCGGNTPGSSSVTNSVVTADNRAQTQAPFNDDNITVPDTTLPQGQGRAHTNHLILAGRSKVVPNFSGYAPSQIKTAYGLPSSSGQGTIVIVDAYDDPYALSDFNNFSGTYGLPKETSTNVTSSSNAHFQIVYASGSKPAYNSGWSQEEALDIEWAHAIAPNAKIVLVEAASNSNSNLYGADNLAASISGAHECSNSWGGGESSGETTSDSTFNHTAVVYFFSGGDTGGSMEYPAESPNVVACGGTSLTLNSSNGRSSETVWSGTGCGLSSYEARPSFQNSISTIVGSHRGADDVAAVADPNTGVRVVWNGSWYIFGGTSVACPILAAITNVAGANRSNSQAEDTYIYSKMGTTSFFDVTSGSAGSYGARTGWDYPTGVGAPKGTSGF